MFKMLVIYHVVKLYSQQVCFYIIMRIFSLIKDINQNEFSKRKTKNDYTISF